MSSHHERPQIMVQFCHQRLYYFAETVFCCLLLRMARMEMDCNLEKKYAKRFQFFQRVDIKSILNGYGLFSLNEIKLICSFKCLTQGQAWIKFATDNFGTVLTKNLRNPRDYAPLIGLSLQWLGSRSRVCKIAWHH